MRGPSPLYIKERHRALGRDATFSWSRALTHPPRCNRTRHRGRHLVSDFVGSPSWISRRGGRHLGSEVMGAAILDRKSWGPPSWTGSDVKNSIVAPILLMIYEDIPENTLFAQIFSSITNTVIYICNICLQT